MTISYNFSAFRRRLTGPVRTLGLVSAIALYSAGGLQAQTLRTSTDVDLKLLDPIWTATAQTMVHGLMVYDTLFGMDENDEPQPQMVESYTLSDDGLTYTFVLRDGLLFSDESPVESKDVIASIKRWSARRAEGQLLLDRLDSMTAIDAKTFEIKLKKPFALLIRGLANPVLPMFVMREEEASTDPNEQISTVIGSGPFVFRADLWRPGDLVVYEKSKTYVPRQGPASGQAGGKVVNIDRVESRYMPDGNTAVGALRNGEIDFIDSPPQDSVEALRGDPDYTIKTIDVQGMMGTIRLNTLHPPFDDVNARKAVQASVDQASILAAMVGTPDMYTVCYSIFGCGPVPNETEAGTEPWRGQNLEKAKAYLAASDYDGSPIVVMVPSDDQQLMNQTLVLNEYLKQAGFNIDAQSMDWSTLATRRNNTTDATTNPDSGWDLFGTWLPGSFFKDPFNLALVATGDPKTAWYGWPKDEKLEDLRAAWVDAPTPKEQKDLIDQIQVEYYETIPQVYTGQFYQSSIYRSNVTDVLAGSYPVFWNLKKAE